MAENRSTVLVLGYGEMGHAMQALLAARHHLYFWDKKHQDGFHPCNLEQTAPHADFVLFCLPVNPHYEIATHIKPLIKKTALCLSIAKGLDEQGRTAAQIFAEVFGQNQPYALLYGPMIAEEIQRGRHAFAQLACQPEAFCSQVIHLFEGSHLAIEPCNDISGISWSVILKNVYAMAFGMADELQLGDNVRGFLAVSALHELEQIVRLMGGQKNSPFHLAGLGDLITTATSEDSHHHELGRKLARGERNHIEGEGVHTLAMVQKHQLFPYHHFPLFMLMAEIIAQPEQTREKIKRFLSTTTTKAARNL